MFIDNQWRAGSDAPFISRNPATEEVVWKGNAAGKEDVDAAVGAARKAHLQWQRTPLEVRIQHLEAFADLLQTNFNALSEAISKEMGKPLWESHLEVKSVIGKVAISIEAYQQRCPEITHNHPLGKSITRHKSHGVMAVFGAFNFPAHLPHGHIIPALLAGNTVIFKPSEQTPYVGELMALYWEQSGLPAGVFNMIQGGRETGRLLLEHPHIDGLLFTGSWETGLLFSEYLAKHPERLLALEMGGNNPLIVSTVSNLKAAAYTTIQSAYITSGQRCSCARRLILPKTSMREAFTEELVRQIKEIKVGPYTDSPEPFMGPVINESTALHLLSIQDTLRSKGGIPLVEMHAKKVDTSLLSPGLMDVTNISMRLDEEIFGPFLQLIHVADFDAAIEEANRTAYGLSAGLISDNEEEYSLFYQHARAGVVNWNTPLTGASSAAPFGGIGRSGNHRPSAFYAADYCSYPIASIEAPVVALPKELPPGLNP